MSTVIEEATIVLPDEFVTNSSVSPQAAISVEKLAQRVLQKFPIPLSQGRRHDSVISSLPSSAAGDDISLVGGTYGTDCPMLSAGDLFAAGATTRYARFQVVVPDNYQDGETIQLQLRCAMETTVADVSCTVDCEAFLGDGTGGVGTDVVTTSAVSMNSLTPADINFTLAPNSIDPGDLLDVRIAIACNDADTGTAVTPVIYSVTLLCDTRG